MEARLRWVLVTAIAPIAWGTNYYVTRQLLPSHYPLYGAAIRALPAGLLLLLVARRRPHGAWWWRAAVLGTLTMGAFFALVYIAAQSLPTNLASTIMAASPIVMLLLAWVLLGERPTVRRLAAAGVGIGGVCLMLLGGVTAVSVLGVTASIAAMAISSLGFVLTKRWGAGVDVLALTSWQLIAGGLVLLPAAAVIEGAPPALDGRALLGFGYVSLVATALADWAWFAGLRRLSVGTVGLVGLLNPVTGVLLGTVVAAEGLSATQAAGLALVLIGILVGRPGRAEPMGRPASVSRRGGIETGLRHRQARRGSVHVQAHQPVDGAQVPGTDRIEDRLVLCDHLRAPVVERLKAQ
jgi:probable blue pigment (indigoidine) exporter